MQEGLEGISKVLARAAVLKVAAIVALGLAPGQPFTEMLITSEAERMTKLHEGPDGAIACSKAPVFRPSTSFEWSKHFRSRATSWR